MRVRHVRETQILVENVKSAWWPILLIETKMAHGMAGNNNGTEVDIGEKIDSITTNRDMIQ